MLHASSTTRVQPALNHAVIDCPFLTKSCPPYLSRYQPQPALDEDVQVPFSRTEHNPSAGSIGFFLAFDDYVSGPPQLERRRIVDERHAREILRDESAGEQHGKHGRHCHLPHGDGI